MIVRYKRDPNWKGGVNSDSDSGSNIEDDSDSYQSSSPGSEDKSDRGDITFTPGSYLAMREVRHGDEGIEVRLPSQRYYKNKSN